MQTKKIKINIVRLTPTTKTFLPTIKKPHQLINNDSVSSISIKKTPRERVVIVIIIIWIIWLDQPI